MNLCYSKISVVMLLGYRIDGISRKLESEREKMSCAQMLHIEIASTIQAWCRKYETVVAGPRSAVGNVSGYRCVSDCRSRGREFDPGPVPYFRGD